MRIGFGFGLMLFGSFEVLFGIIAVLDPIGTKMADDGDSFGIPPTITESLTLTIIFVVTFLFGLWLILNPQRLIEKFSKIELK